MFIIVRQLIIREYSEILNNSSIRDFRVFSGRLYRFYPVVLGLFAPYFVRQRFFRFCNFTYLQPPNSIRKRSFLCSMLTVKPLISLNQQSVLYSKITLKRDRCALNRQISFLKLTEDWYIIFLPSFRPMRRTGQVILKLKSADLAIFNLNFKLQWYLNLLENIIEKFLLSKYYIQSTCK